MGGLLLQSSQWKEMECASLMEKSKLQPLTEMEKRMAEENHNLVYSFLHRHGYSIEEFYNVVIFGYLRGIQVYNRKEDIRKKYQLAFICERNMLAETKDYFRSQNSQKRKPMEITVSLDINYAETDNIYNLVSGKSVEDEVLESKQVDDMMENLSEVQRDILKLKLEGYDNKEILSLLGIPSSSFYKEMNRIKVIMEKLVG